MFGASSSTRSIGRLTWPGRDPYQRSRIAVHATYGAILTALTLLLRSENFFQVYLFSQFSFTKGRFAMFHLFKNLRMLKVDTLI